MRISNVKDVLKSAIGADRRKFIASILDRVQEHREAGRHAEANEGIAIAKMIESLPEFELRVVRPETVLGKVELARGAVVAGRTLHPITDEIIGRETFIKDGVPCL